MAYVASNRVSGFHFGDFFAAAVAGAKAVIARRAEYKRILAELEALSDRDLSDIGIARIQISDVARQAAYSK